MYMTARVVENRSLARGNFVLRLALPDDGAALRGALPGQFVMLRGEWGRDPLLPRAFSILRLCDGGCEILVKAIGRGTRLLELALAGAPMTLLGPLGKPFPAPEPARTDILVAGGVGLAPLLWHAEVATAAGTRAAPLELLYGARGANDLVLLDEIARTQAQLHITTEDGTRGTRGRVTVVLEQLLAAGVAKGARILTCGPNPMMRAVVELARKYDVPCLVSVEGEMACGIGACLGCALPLVAGPPPKDGGAEGPVSEARPFAYACVDGPVFDSARVVIP